ncbi:hypothetical protein PAEPH01_0637 [Pancytospora epiphaga]|nr:hypothetical protein PAEPH01_0637 [Pancytospora epiphaga]
MSMAKEYLGELLEYFSDSRYLCIKEILAENMTASRKLGLKIYDKHPQYLLLSLYMDMPNSKPLLLRFLKKMVSIDPMFLYILINSGYVDFSDLQRFLPAGEEKGFMNAAIRRDWFLRSDNLEASSSNKSKSEILFELLDRIDDFRLYEYAIDRGIIIPTRNTANYKWYIVQRDQDRKYATELIIKTANFQDIYKLCELSGVREVSDGSYDLLIKYLFDGYSEGLLRQAVDLFNSSKSFLNCKILLSLLIASRRENNLVLALYLSYSIKFEDNYELDLVHLFLNRYFCFHKNIHKLMKKMSIKNIQIYNNAYIWTDPMILTGDSESYLVHISKFNLMHRRDLGTIESKIASFLESGMIGHAISLTKLYKGLEEAVCIKEVASFKILATDGKTMYSGLLGEQCDYLFNKITVKHEVTGKGSLRTLYGSADGSSYKAVLENPFININCPEFLYEFSDLVSSK